MTCSMPNPMTKDYEIIFSTSFGQDERRRAPRSEQAEVPGWDLALTLSSCSGDLTSPAHNFPPFILTSQQAFIWKSSRLSDGANIWTQEMKFRLQSPFSYAAPGLNRVARCVTPRARLSSRYWGAKFGPSDHQTAQAPTTSATQAVEDCKKLALWPDLEGFMSNFSPFWPLGPLEKLSFTQLHPSTWHITLPSSCTFKALQTPITV